VRINSISYQPFDQNEIALPFDPSLLVHFRQRISPNLINKVNERMVEKMRSITPVKTEKKRIRTQKMSHPIKEN